MKNRFLFIALYLLATLTAGAQEGKLYTVNQELSSSMINQVYQDREGIIWISTEEGLNRYDGAKFTIFKNEEGNPQSLPYNYVRCTFESSKGEFFIGTLNGIYLYDRDTKQFVEIPMKFDDGTYTKANVSCITECSNGDILAGTAGHNIFRLKADRDSLIIHQDLSLTPCFFINHLYIDRSGRLWISNVDEGIRLITSSGEVQTYLDSYNISCVCEDLYGNIYAGSYENGVFVRYKNADGFIPIPHTQSLSSIRALYAANQDEIYIGTDGDGVKIYHTRNKELKDASFNIGNLNIKQAKVHTITKDNQGNTWLGCFQKGVVVIPATSNGFKYYGPKSADHDLIGSCCIMSVCYGHDDRLWIGTDNDGVYVLQPDGKQSKHYAGAPSTVMSIYEDSRHDIWLGSYQQGLFKLNAESGKIQHIPLPNPFSNSPINVYAITEDGNGGLWVATMGNGLYRVDTDTYEAEIMPTVSDGRAYRVELNVQHNRWINCMTQSSDGKLYLGTYDGLECMDIATRDFVSTFGVNRLFQGEFIHTLYEDAEGYLWIGTGKGLKRFNPKTQETVIYTTKDGLPGNSISAIRGDNQGYLWISTNYGISRMTVKDKTFVNFYASDGIQGNEFIKNSVSQSRDGDICFGGTEGITLFQPQIISNPHKKPDIRISDFYIYDRAVNKGMKSGTKEIIDTSVSQAKEFHLSHGDNSFSIEFSAMELYNPERITYIYNFNHSGWISLQPGVNRVSFSHVQPGKYTFQVRAKDNTALSDVKEILILISPPWYATWWAKVLYTLFALAVITFVVLQIRHRYRIRQQMLEHQHAEEINEAKLQFFINISHEIRTPMSLIISPLQKLISKDKDEERQQSYRLIHRNSERILNLINQLMDIRKIDKGQMVLRFREMDIVAFVKDVYTVFEYQAKTKNIQLDFVCPDGELKAWIDRKNFDKIIFNLVSNAIKYTPQGGHIGLFLSTGENPDAPTPALRRYLELQVKDDGIGLNEAEIHRIFDRFYQIQNNPNNNYKGTGIGLHLTRSLVELHQGEIIARNNEDGKGCSFIVRIPLGKEHIKPENIEDMASATERTNIPNTSTSPSADTGTKAETPLRSKSKHRILVVEDDEEIRRYLYKELGRDFHVHECENGKDALAWILQKKPDLVISDVMMPEMDGMTLCRKIKQNVNINHIPVILLTAKTREEDTVEGLQQGADAYITKPFHIEILRQTILNLIKGRELLKNNFSGNQEQEDKVTKLEVESPDERLLSRVMKVINDNLGNTSLNVEMIASEVGISRVHLHRKLKELTNQSTRDFIRNVRLKQAAVLLAEKKHSVSEVATLTGFPNVAYFSTAFKDLFGVSPSSYTEQRG